VIPIGFALPLSSALYRFRRRSAAFVGALPLSSALCRFRRRSAAFVGALPLSSALCRFRRRSAAFVGRVIPIRFTGLLFEKSSSLPSKRRF